MSKELLESERESLFLNVIKLLLWLQSDIEITSRLNLENTFVLFLFFITVKPPRWHSGLECWPLAADL